MVKVLLVGCGKMGEALATGWLDRGIDSADITVVEPVKKSARNLVLKGVRYFTAPDQLPGDILPAVVIFAIKPQVMDHIVPFYARFSKSTVFMSIAAGRTLSYFEKLLGNEASIVRVMPNTPASVQKGISCAICNTNVSASQKAICNDLMRAVGELYWLDIESQIDAVTAVSGSGPAYVFLLAECLAKVGQNLGLPKPLAERLGRVTIYGSGELLHQSQEDLVTLRKNVTSPGGTTEAALNTLMNENAFENLIDEAVSRAAERSKELAL